MSFDFRGLPTIESNASGSALRAVYDGRGNLVRSSQPDLRTVRFEYDALGRLTSRTYPDGAADTFSYDAQGNIVSAQNQHVTYTFSYDGLSRPTSVRDSRFDATIRYEYDRAGRRARMIDPQDGATTYSYGPTGALVSVRNPAGSATEFRYDAAGRVSEVQYANSTRQTLGYDAGGRFSSIVYLNAGQQVLNHFDYSYDRVGNSLSETDLAGRRDFAYDAIYRLTAATHPARPSESYAYDAADQLLRTSRARYQYDLNGNLSVRRRTSTGGARRSPRSRSDSAGTTRYQYDALNRLVLVETGTGLAVEHRYGPLGRRIEENVNGRVARYLYDGDNILEEYDRRNRLLARYTHGLEVDEPLIMERDQDGDGGFDPRERFFYQSDRLGSITALADSTGAIVERYEYDSFGNLTAVGPGANPTISAVGNPFFYTGREWDAEIGLYYYRARHYDPETGRFLQRDPVATLPLPESLNRYVYVANNPLNSVDPTGRRRVQELSPFQEQFVTEAIQSLASEESIVERTATPKNLINRISTGEGITVGILNLQANNANRDILKASQLVLQRVTERITELEGLKTNEDQLDFFQEQAEELGELRTLRGLIQVNCR